MITQSTGVFQPVCFIFMVATTIFIKGKDGAMRKVSLDEPRPLIASVAPVSSQQASKIPTPALPGSGSAIKGLPVKKDDHEAISAPDNLPLLGRDHEDNLRETATKNQLPMIKSQSPRIAPPIRDEGVMGRAQGIVNACAISIEDSLLKKRLVSAVATHLEGKATFDHLKESFERSRKIGGMGLTPEQSQKCLVMIQGALTRATPAPSPAISSAPSSLKPSPALRPSVPSEAPMKPIEKKLEEAPQRPKPPLAPPPTLPLAQPKPAQQSALLRQLQRSMQASQQQSTDQPKPPQRVPLPAPVPPAPRPITPSPIPTPPVEGKPVPPQPLSSVSAQPQIVADLGLTHTAEHVAQTPAGSHLDSLEDELTMAVSEFRRLGATAQARVEAVKGLLKTLEKEAYTRRLTGIDKWRASPVMNEYMAIGKESLSKGLSVQDVINARTASGNDTLTPEEFRAIMMLNKEIEA